MLVYIYIFPSCCRLFGTTGYCSVCSKVIPAFEMVMRARGNVYHLECFACQQCNHRYSHTVVTPYLERNSWETDAWGQ